MRTIHRRFFLGFVGCGIPAALSLKGAAKTVKIVQFNASGVRTGVVDMEKVVKTEAEWKKQLDPLQFEITRHADTERPGSGKYANNHADGLYHCICCDITLFDSKTKFESGTGWPSFYQPIAKENVIVRRDTSHGMLREEVVCTRCDAHLGHLFDDGPPPTGLRYCMNSGSLNFVARQKK